MIPITASTSIFVAVEPIDFRKQFDGIIAHCRHSLKVDPRSGALFVFINRTRTMIRVLVYDINGYWLMSKRLSKGSFQGWPTIQEPLSALHAGELIRILRTSSRELRRLEA